MSSEQTHTLATENLQSIRSTSTHASGPTASLLTSLPVEALLREIQSISAAGPRLEIINSIIFIFIDHDNHANALRARLIPFNQALYRLVDRITVILVRVREFYGVDDEEFDGTTFNQPVTPEQISRLLSPAYQAIALDLAEDVIRYCEEISQKVQEDVIPFVQNVVDELNSFVEEYIDRDEQMQVRALLWLPNLFLDYLWGHCEPVMLPVTQIRPLPDDFAACIQALKRIPSLLENIRLHFQRLCEVAKTGIEGLGYSSLEDLERLYKDRLTCVQYTDMMQEEWGQMNKSFGISALGGSSFFDR